MRSSMKSIELFLTFITGAGRTDVEQIVREDLFEFIENEQDRGLKPQTVNRHSKLTPFSVSLGNAEEYGGYSRSTPFFLMSRRVQPATIRWFQNPILLSLRFSSRFSISSAKRSRRRGQGD